MRPRPSSRAGYTLIELLVAAAVVVVAGATLYFVTRTVAYLSAKNAAINLTHTQARTAIHRAVTEIRDSVSIPQLTDATGTSLGASLGPAAGVSYQQVVGDPCQVWSNAAAGQNQIVIKGRAGDPVITPGMRLIVPAFFVEDDITLATGTPALRTVTLAHNLPTTISCSGGAPNYVAYFTQRSALIVVGTELRYFPDRAAAGSALVSSNITTPTPFSISSSDNRFIQAALATQDPRILNRGFKSMNLQMTLTIPYRYRLTTYQ